MRSGAQGGIGLGTGKVQLLLDKHEYSDCVGMKASTPERNCVTTARENSLNGDSRAWKYFKYMLMQPVD
jgi:hypothetical protein